MTVKEFRAELGFLEDNATVVVELENGDLKIVDEIKCDCNSDVPKDADPSQCLGVITFK